MGEQRTPFEQLEAFFKDFSLPGAPVAIESDATLEEQLAELRRRLAELHRLYVPVRIAWRMHRGQHATAQRITGALPAIVDVVVKAEEARNAAVLAGETAQRSAVKSQAVIEALAVITRGRTNPELDEES